MADFRKWFLAFAVAALLCSLAVPASAQAVTQPLACVANAASTPQIRAEGLAELVGDVVLNCTGGTPTPSTQVVPQANITIQLSTNITSRLVANPFTEALIIVDDPHSEVNPDTPLKVCGDGDTTESPAGSGVCTIMGTGDGVGTYDGSANRPNVFQGRATGVNQITFFGIPVDPPGTSGGIAGTGRRSFRITNVRANASQLGVSSTLIPSQVTMFISMSLLPIQNPQVTVAYVYPGLQATSTSASFTQCTSVNPGLAAGTPDSDIAPGFSVTFTEGFAYAWKENNINTHLANIGLIGSGADVGTVDPTSGTYTVATPDQYGNQDIPGVTYYTESGFMSVGNAPSSTTGLPPLAAYDGSFPSGVHGVSNAGVATQGTRLMLTFGSVPNGAQLFVPAVIPLVNSLVPTKFSGLAVATVADANGAGGFTAAGGAGTLVPVTLFGGSGVVVYEIVLDDPFNTEQLSVPVVVAFQSNTGDNLPAPGVQATVQGSFGPLSTIQTMSETAPVPRFVPSSTPKDAFIINKCTCNLLFPFVTNQAGFDTGIAIANTSQDPFGTDPQEGTITLNYYSAGTPPAAQTTNAVVPAGDTLTFTLSGGGNYGITATPNFQGYIIASAEFQWCHGFAFITDTGAQRVAQGYLGLVLSEGLHRDLPQSESLGQ